ncbi:MAG: tetratricopeptide repeat protein [Proteobacteria bacterium]|nr:tetratricopeptide repeat protein [Pseudomonadota bacterium]MBU1710241.1 tetratricopeptide repeat protein [Pseudomonadota bacterium]
MSEKKLNQETAEELKPKDPAQEDYEQGQKFHSDLDTALAANAFHNALIGFEQSNNESGVANASDKLGDICQERNEYQKALEHYRRAFDICDRLKDAASVISLQKKMAVSYLSLGQHQETLKIYFELFDTFSDWKNPGLIVEMLEKIAELYVETNEKDKAIDAYNTAASIHNNYGHPNQAQIFLNKATELAGQPQ